MKVVVDVEYGGVVVKWVWVVVTVACISYGVSPNRAAHAHSSCYVCVVLCDSVCGWWACCEDSLLQFIEVVCHFKHAHELCFSSCLVSVMPLGFVACHVLGSWFMSD